MNKKILTTLLAISAFIATTLLAIFTPAYTQEEFLKKEFNTNPIFSTTGEPLKRGFATMIDNRDDYKFVITNYNPFNPVYSFVAYLNAKPDTNNIAYAEIQTISLKRKDIFNFIIVSTTTMRVDNITYNKAVALAQKYDLSKENPDPENITVYKKPTQAEIDSTKKAQGVNSNPEFRAERDKCSVDNLPGTKEEYDCIKAAEKRFGL